MAKGEELTSNVDNFPLSHYSIFQGRKGFQGKFLGKKLSLIKVTKIVYFKLPCNVTSF